MDDNLYILAQSIFYWLNYNSTVTKSNLLLESSVRFPLVECLERRIGAIVELEADHEVFDGLKVDFRYTLSNKDHYIELKFLHDYSNNPQERKRYFDDLVRLALLGDENFFILCGNWEYLENRVKQFLPSVTSPKDMQKERRPQETVFPKWLSFNDINETQTFCPTDFWRYVGSTKHEKDKDRQIPEALKQIRTKLVAKQNDNKSSQVVYIWRISK